MDITDDPGTCTSVDEAQVISLIRSLLPVAQQPAGAEADHGVTMSDAMREQAGTLLWDLSVIGPVAELMVHQGMIFSVMEALIPAELVQEASREGVTPSEAAADPGRPLEVLFGILGNLVTHDDIALLLAARYPALLDTITFHALHSLSSSAALGELCRLTTTALSKPGSGQWLRRLQGPAELERVVWIARKTLDPVTHARALDMIVAILHAHLLRARGLVPSDQGAGEGVGGACQGATQPVDSHMAGAGEEDGQPGSGGAADTDMGGGGLDAEEPQGGGGVLAGPGDCVGVLLQLGLLQLVAQVLRQAAEQVLTDPVHREDKSSFTPAGPRAPHPPHPHTRTPALPRPSRFTPRLPAVASSSALAAQDPRDPQSEGLSEGHAELPVTDDAVDAALRVLEELGGMPEGSVGQEAVHGDLDMGVRSVTLLHCTPSEQVLSSLLLALQAQGPSAVAALASSLAHISALLDCLGELPDGETGAWQRELVLYLTAKACQHLSNNSSSAETTTRPTPPVANGRTAHAPGGRATSGVTDFPPVHQASVEEVLELSERVVSLPHTCGVTGTHVRGYLVAAARAMLSLLTAREAELSQHSDTHTHHHHHGHKSGSNSHHEQHRLKMHVQKVVLELREMLVV